MLVLTLIEFILIAIWLLGVVTSYTFGGFIHVFLGLAILLIISRVIGGGNGSGSDDI